MKIARFVLKIVAISLAVASLVCAAVAYWDKLAEACGSARGRLKRSACASEYDDYEEERKMTAGSPAVIFIRPGSGWHTSAGTGCFLSGAAGQRTEGRRSPP